ncbi:MAG: hypothetical protein ACRCYQ_09215 [Nocardioides sp.]
MAEDSREDAQARAWGWVAHLRAGGSTTWSSYDGPAAPTAGERLPGAQQLELLRRVNESAGRRGQSPNTELVLRSTLAGRGQPEFGLLGTGDRRPEIDPKTLGEPELLRVAGSSLADALILRGLPAITPRPPARRRHKPFRLIGDPWLAIPMRRALAEAGHPPGGMRAPVFVLGTGFAAMVVHAWSAGCLDSNPAPWPTWLSNWLRRDRTPKRIDLPAIAALHRKAPLPPQFVLDPRALAPILGARRPLADAPQLSADALELSRRIGTVLGSLVSQSERAALLRGRLLPLLETVGGPVLRLPDEQLQWAAEQARRMRAVLTSEEHAIHGGADLLLAGADGAPADRPSITEPSQTGVLQLAIATLGGVIK